MRGGGIYSRPHVMSEQEYYNGDVNVKPKIGTKQQITFMPTRSTLDNLSPQYMRNYQPLVSAKNADR